MKQLSRFMIERKSHPEAVAPRVTAIRETLSLKKAEFADALGLDRSSLTKIENGTAGLDIATGERISVLYGFGLDFIYREDLDDVPLQMRADLVKNLSKARSS